MAAEQTITQAIELLSSPLPLVKEGEALTEDQWKVLFAIGDAVVANIGTGTDTANVTPTELDALRSQLQSNLPAGTDPSIVDVYLKETASEAPMIKEALHRLVLETLRSDARDGIRMILSTLNTRAGSLLLTGSTTMIYDQPITIRQQIIQNWGSSYLPPLRMLAKSFTSLFKQHWLKLSPNFAKVIGFPRVPVHGTQGQGFQYNFLQFSDGDDAETIETDVLIIGSGCGGGVCAKNIAEAGQRVLVVEKAYHFEPQHLPMTEHEGGIHLFANGGADLSDDQSILIVSGQAWGGGGTINWSASLQTQSYVRQEWANEGLSFFTSAEFQQSLDRVCERMGASSDYIEHNKTNRVLIEGARKLGLNCKPVPQNTGGKQHYCGYCTYGCGSAEKQGPVVSWLPDAARAGAQFIEGFDADKITFASGSKTATGVTGTWTSRDIDGGLSGTGRYTRKINIKAKRTIVSCGTLNSPLLLLRSGLTNPQIGRNLHLHPVAVVAAVMPETVNPWEGGILTAVVDSLQDLDGQGHGPKLEAITMMPALMLTGIPWTSAIEWKEMAAKFKNMVGFISLARDRDTGRVYPDKNDGKTRIAYNPSKHDRKNIMEGVLTLAKIAFIEGATEIIHCLPGVPIYKRDPAESQELGINSPSFQSWLGLVRKRGFPDPDSMFASAHQMGTCRMSTNARSGVVDASGKVWGTEGLYVADASVFPSASGVNPMVTNMAISDWISKGVAREMSAAGVISGAGVGAEKEESRARL